MTTTFERRRTILRILSEQRGVRVTDLARLLDASEGTIRNDLIALDEEGHLLRVRGGAVVREDALSAPGRAAPRGAEGNPAPGDLMNSAAKQQIARWAAELVENGDTLICDASTTVGGMAPYLRDRHGLTVITNGLEIARGLAENPSNTVILVGGVLAPDGSALLGAIAERTLRDLHARRAFISCAGVGLETGLTEVDLQQANLKAQFIRAADETVLLADSSKFGKQELTPFAALPEMDYVFTDSAIEAGTVARLRALVPALTICEERTVTSYARQAQPDPAHYRIGFANLSETLPFAVDVRRGLERAAKESGNIDLIVSDNQLSAETAVEVANELLARGIDLMIEYQIDESIGSRLMNRFNQAGIPVIAVDIPLVGATFFGVDNYQAGALAGAALGAWITTHWAAACDALIVLEEARAGTLPAQRIQGQLDALRDQLGELPRRIDRLQSGNTSATSYAAVRDLLESIPPAYRVAVLAFNDDAAIGALHAIREAGRESQCVIVGQGADHRGREFIREPGSRFIGSTGFMPEQYGAQLIALAARLLRGEAVPPALFSRCAFITAANIRTYYPQG